jgi:hypothetical protein
MLNTPIKLSSVHNGWTSGLLDLSLGLMLSYLSLPHARNRWPSGPLGLSFESPSGLLVAWQSGACDITWASARIDKFLHFMVKVLADDGTKTDIVALSGGYTRLEAGVEGRVKSKDERYPAGSASNASSSVQAGHHSRGETGQNP